MKPVEQTQINFIVDCLRNGLSTAKVLAKFGEKWRNVSKRTFERRLKAAEPIFQAEQKRIQAEAERQVAKEIEARKSQIMTAIERKELLSNIAWGKIKIKKPFVISGKIMEYPSEPDFADRKNAISELNKMEGEYAPAKSEVSLLGGIKTLVVEPVTRKPHKDK